MAGGLKKLCNTQIYGSGKGKQYGAQPIESVSGPHAAADRKCCPDTGDRRSNMTAMAHERRKK